MHNGAAETASGTMRWKGHSCVQMRSRQGVLPGASQAAYLEAHMAEPLRVLPLHVPLQAFQGGERVCANRVAMVAGPRSHPLQLGMQWPAGSSSTIKHPQ